MTGSKLLLRPATIVASLLITVAHPPTANAQRRINSYPKFEWSCSVDQKTAHGIATLTRTFSDDGKVSPRDYASWEAETSSEKSGAVIRWSLRSFWKMESADVDEANIELIAEFDTSAQQIKLPEAGILQFRLPTEEQYGWARSVGFMVGVYDLRPTVAYRARASFHLSDLLRYTDGADEFHWLYGRFSESAGFYRTLVEGKIDLTQFRDVPGAWKSLRPALDALAENHQKNCKQVPYVPPPPLV